jgi:tetratricopeptide (TPR) repeat protein
VLFRALGRDKEALGDLDALIRGDPSHARALYHRGSTLLSAGRAADAQRDLLRSVTIDPTDGNLDAVLRLGLTHQLLGEPDAALRHYDRVLSRAPRHALALVYRGYLRAVLGDPPLGLADINSALSIMPGMHVAIHHRGLVHNLNNSPQLATKDLLESMPHMGPGTPELHVSLAIALTQSGDTTTALEHLYKAAAMAPGDPAVYNHRGVALMGFGSFDAAKEDFETALRLAGVNGLFSTSQNNIAPGIHSTMPHPGQGRSTKSTMVLPNPASTPSPGSRSKTGGAGMTRQFMSSTTLVAKPSLNLPAIGGAGSPATTPLSGTALSSISASSPTPARARPSAAAASALSAAASSASPGSNGNVNSEEAIRVAIEARINLASVMLRSGGDAHRALELLSPPHIAEGAAPFDALFNRGIALVQLKLYAEAVTAFALAEAQYDPSTGSRCLAELLNLRGVAKHRVGDLDGALSDYSRSIVADGTYADPLVNRGQLFMATHAFQRAFDDFHTATRWTEEANDKIVFRLLEMSRTWVRVWSAACDDFTYAVAFNPELALLDFEGPNLDIGFFDERPFATDAERDADRAMIEADLEARPNDPLALTRLAAHAVRTGDAATAREAMPAVTRALYAVRTTAKTPSGKGGGGGGARLAQLRPAAQLHHARTAANPPPSNPDSAGAAPGGGQPASAVPTALRTPRPVGTAAARSTRSMSASSTSSLAGREPQRALAARLGPLFIPTVRALRARLMELTGDLSAAQTEVEASLSAPELTTEDTGIDVCDSVFFFFFFF